MKTIIDYTNLLKSYFAAKKDLPVKTAPQTLTAGSTTLTFSNAAITSNSTIVPYVSVLNLPPKAITVTTGQAVVEYEAQSSDISVYLEIK